MSTADHEGAECWFWQAEETRRPRELPFKVQPEFTTLGCDVNIKSGRTAKDKELFVVEEAAAIRRGMAEFQLATQASNFFSPLKLKREQKIFNSSKRKMRHSPFFNGLQLHASDMPPKNGGCNNLQQKTDFMTQKVEKLQLDLDALAHQASSRPYNNSVLKTLKKPKQPLLAMKADKKRQRLEDSSEEMKFCCARTLFGSTLAKNHCRDESAKRRTAFESVKRKLTFDEDFMTLLPSTAA